MRPSGPGSSSSGTTSRRASYARRGRFTSRARRPRWRPWCSAHGSSRASSPPRCPFGSTDQRTLRSPRGLDPTDVPASRPRAQPRTRARTRASMADCCGIRRAISPRSAGLLDPFEGYAAAEREATRERRTGLVLDHVPPAGPSGPPLSPAAAHGARAGPLPRPAGRASRSAGAARGRAGASTSFATRTAALAEAWRGRSRSREPIARWQAITDASVFYLLSSTHASSLASTSLFGLAYWPNYHYYHGHVMWDIETFTVPPLLCWLRTRRMPFSTTGTGTCGAHHQTRRCMAGVGPCTRGRAARSTARRRRRGLARTPRITSARTLRWPSPATSTRRATSTTPDGSPGPSSAPWPMDRLAGRPLRARLRDPRHVGPASTTSRSTTTPTRTWQRHGSAGGDRVRSPARWRSAPPSWRTIADGLVLPRRHATRRHHQPRRCAARRGSGRSSRGCSRPFPVGYRASEAT